MIHCGWYLASDLSLSGRGVEDGLACEAEDGSVCEDIGSTTDALFQVLRLDGCCRLRRECSIAFDTSSLKAGGNDVGFFDCWAERFSLGKDEAVNWAVEAVGWPVGFWKHSSTIFPTVSGASSIEAFLSGDIER